MRGYIILLPFSSAFALASFLPLPLVYLVFHLLFSVFSWSFSQSSAVHVSNAEKFLAALLFTICASSCINLIIHTGDAISRLGNVVAYAITIMVFYFYVRHLFIKFFSRNSVDALTKLVFFVVLVVSIYTVLEFFLKNFLGVDLDLYIYRPVASDINPISMGVFYRARGFTEEPGHLLLFLEIFVPIALYYLIRNKRKLMCAICGLIFFAAALATFSSAFYLTVPVSFILVVVVYVFRNIGHRTLMRCFQLLCLILILAVLLELALTLLGLNGAADIYSAIARKLSGSTSMNERMSGINSAVDYFQSGNIFNYLFGFGAGYHKTAAVTGVVSLYFLLLVEAGLVGLILFLSFCVYVFKTTMKIQGELKYFLLFALIASLMHYAFISNYWYPWFWFLSAMILSIQQCQRQSAKVFQVEQRYAR